MAKSLARKAIDHIINEQIPNYNKLTREQISNLCFDVRDLLVKTNKNQSDEISKEHQYLYSKNKVNSNLQKFCNQYGNSFKIKTYEPNEVIPNKLFVKFSSEELTNPNNFPENYINNIILYNLEELDLFTMLVSAGLDVDQITMDQLMEFFSSYQLLYLHNTSTLYLKIDDKNLQMILHQKNFDCQKFHCDR